jgi:hypothetical protein
MWQGVKRTYRLHHPDKVSGTCTVFPPVPAKNSIEEGHPINFSDTRALARTPGYMNQIMKEAIEIWLHPQNFYRDTGFNLS